jgi:hypothetical protein
MSTLKCYVCKRTQPKEEFQTFKSCQSCRKKKSYKKEVKVEEVKESHPVPIETFALPSTVSNTIESPKWCLLSGKWIRRGEEQRLHTLLLKKVHHQFHRRCAFPIHKYLTKYLMMDIRDV